MENFRQDFKYVIIRSKKTGCLSAVVFSPHLPCQTFIYMDPISAGFFCENGGVDTFGYSLGLNLRAHPLDAIFIQNLLASETKKYLVVSIMDVPDVFLLYDSESFDISDFSSEMTIDSGGDICFSKGSVVSKERISKDRESVRFNEIVLKHLFRNFPISTSRHLIVYR